MGDHLDFIGEEKSTATLEMQGGQVPLVDALARTGKPMIVVLVNSKPQVGQREVCPVSLVMGFLVYVAAPR